MSAVMPDRQPSRPGRAAAVPVAARRSAVLGIAVRGHHGEQPRILDDGKPRVVVRRELRDEVAEDEVPSVDQRRPHITFEELDRAPERRGRHTVEVRHHQPGLGGDRSRRRRGDVLRARPAGQRGDGCERAQQMDIVMLPDHRVGLVAPRQPEGPAVEAGQPAESRRHVLKRADPDEAVGLADQLELSQGIHALVALGLEEVLLEVADEVARLPRRQEVVPQLDDLHGRSPSSGARGASWS